MNLMMIIDGNDWNSHNNNSEYQKFILLVLVLHCHHLVMDSL